MIHPPSWYRSLFEQYAPILNQYTRLYLALSAGIDSNMLLHWLYVFRDQLPPITTIHVNHNWHGKDSYIWADFAKKSAEHYGFSHVNYDIDIQISEKGAEASGREARYIKFAETMIPKSALLVAHHRSDQAETLLFRLIRGSGLKGLGGIHAISEVTFQAHTIRVIRPFLEISKAELYKTGRALNIPWMEDYTNHESDTARNQIRNDIIPVISNFFPFYEQTLSRTAFNLQEAQETLTELAAEDAIHVIQHNILDITKARNLSPLRCKNVIRYWLNFFHLQLEKRQFDEFYTMFFIHPPSSKTAFTIGEHHFRCYQNRLYKIDSPKHAILLDWKECPHSPPKSFWKQFTLKLIPRIEGAYFHPAHRKHAQSVKKLLQENQVLPWDRESLHFLINEKNNEILWIEHLGLNKKYVEFCEDNGIMPVVIRK